MKGGCKHAFTLTELLVAVPVAALLGTMLLAVSNDASQQVKAAACLNNMRQWGLGLMLYANDYRDYFPYDGQSLVSPCAVGNTNAWMNLVPPYIGQQPLCSLYISNTPPTPFTRSIWSCPSSTNVTVQPSMANPYFMYAMSVCWHVEGNVHVGFRRNQMTDPPNTILFCEEPEDNFGETSGEYDTVTRHFGGSNFVFADGHADWIHFTNYCRANNPNGCPAPLGNIQWNDSRAANALGDWGTNVHYHWWPFVNAATGGQI
jgi:prepilin-type processing-associated H-X9-DG protein